MPKKIVSKLDQFSATLLEMDAQHKTLAEMAAWLKEESCVVALSTLSCWLSSARSQAAQERMLNLVASGSQQCADLEAAFAKNPAPELDTLLKLFKVLILNLTTRGETDPKLLQLADQLSRTALEFINGQTKARFKQQELEQAERRLQLSEKRAAQADQTVRVLSDAELSPEQRAQRIKEIYGRA